MRAERGLARAPRPGEQVGLALAAAGDGVAQRPHDVVLPLQLARTGAVGSGGRGTAWPPGRAYRGGVSGTGGRAPPGRRPTGSLRPSKASKYGSGGVRPNRCSRPNAATRRRDPGGARRCARSSAAARPAPRSPRSWRASRRTGPSSTSRPTEIVLTFDGEVGSANQITVACNSNPFTARSQPPTRSDDNLTLTVDILEPMPAGTCNVAWSVSQPSGEAGAVGPLQLRDPQLAGVDDGHHGRPATTGDGDAGDRRRRRRRPRTTSSTPPTSPTAPPGSAGRCRRSGWPCCSAPSC